VSRVFIEAVGLAAPGLPTWQEGRAILRGEAAYLHAPLASPASAMLPANERRRATPAVRLAFQAAEDAMRGTTLPASGLATVFASSDADLAIIHRICTALTNTPRVVSPTDFHNSVHNAAAGYWSIAAGARPASTTISAYDGSFAAGLMEAIAQAQTEEQDVLLVAFDLPAPAPMNATRLISHPAATAMVLTHRPSASTLAAVSCRATAEAETTLDHDALEQLRLGNPAVRGLPLMQSLALGRFDSVILPMGLGSNLAFELRSPRRHE
jgi:hypothetical protein